MTALSNLLALLSLDDSDYLAGLSKNESATGSFVTNLSKIGGGVVAGALGIAAAGVTAIGAAVWQGTQNAIEAQEIQSQLNATLANTGSITGVTAGLVDELANKFQGLTRYEDEVVASGGEVLARFKEINKDVFPQALELSLDLATRLGTDVPSAAALLGKALAVPGEGLKKLKEAGIVFTDEQDKMMDQMMKTGDVAGAQALIMDVVTKAVGGAAQAAGQTAAGQWDRLRNIWGNMLEQLGTGVIPALQKLGETALTYLNRPEVTAFVSLLAEKIANFAATVVDHIPQVIAWVQQFFGFLQNNQGIVIGILAALGVAAAVWGVTTAAAAITAMAPMLPVIAVLLLIGAAVYLLYEAWMNNWGGIQEKVRAAWAVIQPVLQRLWDWLETNIPAAIQALSNYWTTTLLPAIQAVWGWVQTNLMPLFSALAQLIGTGLSRNLSMWAGIWQNVLWPALKAVGGWIRDNIFPVLEWLAKLIGERLAVSFQRMTNFINGVTSALRTLSGWLNSIRLPSCMTPGSPTPWELGLMGVNDALQTLSRSSLPTFQAALQLQTQPISASGMIDLQPRSTSISAETGAGFGRSDASNELLLQDIQRLLRDLPREMAKAVRDASLRMGG